MGTIIAFGNPLLDITVQISDDELLRKYEVNADGAKEVDQDDMKRLLKDVETFDQYLSAGGCAQNTLRVVQWLLERKCNAFMFGSVGDDNESRKLRELLEKDAVQTRYITHGNLPTGNTVALVNNSQRSLVAFLGAAEDLRLEQIANDTKAKELLLRSDCVYVEGFFLTKRSQIARFILDFCNKHNKTVVFNVSNEYMCEQYAETVVYFVENSDVVFGNQREFSALCKVMKKAGVDLLANDLLARHSDKVIVVTNGNKPVTCYTSSETITYDVPEISGSEIVDTTGAGDAFVSGFIAGMVLNQSILNRLKIGCYASLNIIKQPGCTLPVFTPDLSTCIDN